MGSCRKRSSDLQLRTKAGTDRALPRGYRPPRFFLGWLSPIMGPEPVTRASLEPNSATQMKSSSKEDLSLSSPVWPQQAGLKAYRALSEVPVVNDPGRNHRGIVLVADVTVIEAREGTKLGSYKREANLSGAAWGEGWCESEQWWGQSLRSAQKLLSTRTCSLRKG